MAAIPAETHAADPLGVLETTRPIVDHARLVSIDNDAITHTADMLRGAPPPIADWSADLHPAGADAAQLANLVLVVDALNFCFWNIPTIARPRWRVTWQGKTYDGYFALAVALRRAVEQGYPLWDGHYLGTITDDDVQQIFAGDPGCDPIPLLHARMLHLREAGAALLNRWDGTFLNAINAAGGSAPKLARMVTQAMPSFRDVARLAGHEVRFYKRAQILIADLYGAFSGDGPGAFHDLDTLTAFADYKVPQVLRRFGILRYAPSLAERIARFELLPPGGDEELEIRAATIWGIELLRHALAQQGHAMPAFMIDWALWQAGQTLPQDSDPYHRTLTVYY